MLIRKLPLPGLSLWRYATTRQVTAVLTQEIKHFSIESYFSFTKKEKN
jgi:hypothetical protein